jgi:predicted nucleic acid-binding protein
MRVLLDTNVLLRAAEPSHSQHRVAVDAMELLQRDRHDVVVVPQVLYEFWTVATRPVENNGLGMTPAEAHGELQSFQRLFRFLRDERSIYAHWEALVSSLGVRGKTAHDARLVAAMERHGVTHILTFNASDFGRYASVVTLTPAGVLARTP